MRKHSYKLSFPSLRPSLSHTLAKFSSFLYKSLYIRTNICNSIFLIFLYISNIDCYTTNMSAINYPFILIFLGRAAHITFNSCQTICKGHPVHQCLFTCVEIVLVVEGLLARLVRAEHWTEDPDNYMFLLRKVDKHYTYS